MMGKKVLTAAILALMVMTAGCGAAEQEASRAASSAQAQKQEAPQTVSKAAGFELVGMDGKTQAVTPGDGRLYVLNFWATWCPPCRREMPEMDRFAVAHAQDLVFYGINMQEENEKVASFLKEQDYKMNVLLDTSGKAADAYQVRVIPTTVILDGKGEVKFRKEGMATEKELEDALARMK